MSPLHDPEARIRRSTAPCMPGNALLGEHSANPCLTTPVGGGEAPKPLQRSTQAEQDPPRGRVLLAVTGARRQMSPEMGPTESRTTNDG